MDFLAEAKYPMRIFEDNGIPCTWNTVKVGWDLKRITEQEIGKFALDYVEQYPDTINKYILELILYVNKEKIEQDFKGIFESLCLDLPKKNTPIWNKEWFKWRYCIMSEMVKSISDEEELLTQIEGVYADFGYPEDMAGFIYYMPSEESSNKDPNNARKNLVEKLKTFLDLEKIKILKNIGTDHLPKTVISYD